MRRLAALLLALLAWPALAQQPPATAARAAAEQLREAAQRLEQAGSASDRVAALTGTVRAYEDGLAALRDGVRDAAVQEDTLTRDLRDREDETAQLMGTLLGIRHTSVPETLLHPQGPVGTARAGMLLAAITPELTARVAALRTDLVEVRTLRRLREDAVQDLEQGLSGVQQARAELAQALDARADLPLRFAEDPVRTAILLSSTETLDAFAAGLDRITEDDTATDLPSIDARKGTLPLPVAGTVLRAFRAADAAGVERPGIVVAAAPRALVVTPTAATIRYAGPLLDYGLVSILEPQSGLLIVLAGLGTVYGRTGEVLPEGAPAGLLPGGDPQSGGDIVSPIGDMAGKPSAETLYIEVRKGDRPVDPMTWFSTDKG